MAVKTTNSYNYPSVSWADTLDVQRSALRWDVKRAMKSLCSKLAEIGEECFVVTVNVSNGWVGHLGTIRGDEYIDDKSHILYDFLNYCAESLRDDECEDDADNQSSDTESCAADVSENIKPDADDHKPIQISRPSPSHDDVDGSDSEDHVIVETPLRYLPRQPKMTPLPPDLHLNKFIILNPADLPLVTQNIVMATDIATAQSVDAQTDETEVSAERDLPAGSKRKRKQSFEDIARHSRDRQLAGHTGETTDVEIINDAEKKHKYKKKAEDKKKDSYHGNQIETEDTASVGSEHASDVSESNRVLRSTRHQRKKTDWKTLLGKPDEGDENDEVDEENDLNDDYDDFDVDDENDIDWAEDMVVRDRLGRFLPSDSASKKKKNKQKRRKTDEFSESSNKTDKAGFNEYIEVAHWDVGGNLDKNTCVTDSPKTDQYLESSSKEDSIEGGKDGNACISQDTGRVEEVNEKSSNVKGKPRKSKGKVPSGEKRTSTGEDMPKDSVGEAGNVDVDNKQTEEQLIDTVEQLEGSDKKSSKRPSLKRKLRNVANENWAVVDDSVSANKCTK